MSNNIESLKIKQATFIGERHGCWTVSGYYGQVRGVFIWTVQCDCGHQATTSERRFWEFNPLCKHADRKVGKNDYVAFYRSYETAAKLRGYSWELDLAQVTALAKTACHYCRAAPTKRAVLSSKSREVEMTGIDRKNNNLGYVVDNCVPCCSMCNRMKNVFSYEEFIAQCRRITAQHP